MSLPNDHSADELRARATQWFARVRSGDATHTELDACTAWRQAAPSHDEAYRKVEYLWQATAHLPQQKLHAMLSASRAATTSAPPRRQAFSWMAAACATVAVAAVAVPMLNSETPSYRASFSTQAGERRDVTLPDGSVISLNTNTHLEVAYFQQRRDITLNSGQAFFAVEHDPMRQFVVNTPTVTVTVTGTRFDVRPDDSRVAVESGSVQVSAGSWWNKTERQLSAGQAVERDKDGELSAVTPVQIENVLAWRQGKIVFRNAPLPQVVAEMNRYLKHPATLEAPALHNYRVAGVFNIDEPQAILAALPDVAPVQVVELPSGGAVIRPR